MKKSMAQLMLDEFNLPFIDSFLNAESSMIFFCHLTPNMLKSKTSCWSPGSCFLPLERTWLCPVEEACSNLVGNKQFGWRIKVQGRLYKWDSLSARLGVCSVPAVLRLLHICCSLCKWVVVRTRMEPVSQ